MLLLFFCLISTAQMKEVVDSNNSLVINADLGKTIDLPCISPSQFADFKLSLVLWRYNGTVYPIQISMLDQKNQIGRYSQGKNASLRITNVEKSDEMVYTCVAYNGGTVAQTTHIDLVVTGPPTVPLQVTAVPLSANNIRVSWLPGEDNNSPLLHHEVQVFIRHAHPNNQVKMVTYPLTTVEVNQLLPFTTYNVKVQAQSGVGKSDFSVPIQVTTQSGHPKLKPEIVELKPNSTSVLVRVFCLSDTDKLRGEFRGYRANAWLGSRKAGSTTVNTTDNKETSLRISSLAPYTEYRLTVAVFNGRYYGPQQSTTFRTLEGQPGSTSVYKVTNKRSSSFTIWWQDVKMKNGVIQSFKVELYPREKGDRTLVSKEVPANYRNYTFRHLVPYTWYKVRIAASTKMGYGNFSTPLEVLTDVGPPSAPTLLKAMINGSRGVLLNWTRCPDPPTGETKIDYKVCWSLDYPPQVLKDYCLKAWNGASVGPIYSRLDQGSQHYVAIVPWSVFNSAKATKLTLGVRATTNSIFCSKEETADLTSIQCEKEGSLSNTLDIKLTTEDQEFLIDNESGFPLDRTALAGIIAGIFMIVLTAIVISIVTWRTSCVYRGYSMAEQQVELYHLQPGAPLIPTMLTFEQSIYPAIPIANLSDHVFTYHADDDAGYQTEFESIDRTVKTDWPTTVALLPDNVHKNRYSNIFAYDHTRVALQNLYGKKSDYINANFIDGYQKPRAYIAAQGPLPSTFDDFWQMIWEQNSNVIIMISNFIERGRRKCDQYWPSVGTQTYGVVSVKMVSETQLAFYTIRVFAISNAKCKKHNVKERSVYHYQYTDWQDFDVPSSALPVLVFVKCSIRHSRGPIVIHCSAGVGRTGTYICIESLVRQMEREHQVNIRGFLEHIRQQRMKLVQTEQQYAFIHDALHEYLLCPEHQVAKEHFATYLQCLREEEPCGCTRMQKQFQLCVEYEPLEYHSMIAKKQCNIAKNRSDVYPLEHRRVVLRVELGVEGSNYINASHLNGYWNRSQYIVTQHPLDTTEADLWKMIWDKNISVMVVLSPEEMPTFWPTERQPAREVGVLTVNYCRQEVGPLTTRVEFLITSSREEFSLPCHLWRLNQWPETSGDTAAVGELLALSRQVMELGPTAQTLVIDEFGANRAGIFCAINLLMIQLANEHLIDVYFTFKMFHLQRPKIFQSHDDLEFLYSLMERHTHECTEVLSNATPLVNGWIPDRAISPVLSLDMNLSPNSADCPSPDGTLQQHHLHVISNSAIQNGGSLQRRSCPESVADV